jgi:hypothetical protein
VALHGYDPVHQPQLAFNIHILNYHHAAEYFWSAPKHVLTQATNVLGSSGRRSR